MDETHPEGQASHREAPAALDRPTGHDIQELLLVAPDTDEYVPECVSIFHNST